MTAAGESMLLRPSLFRTLLFVLIAASSLVLIDGTLAKTERDETAADADRFYRDGQRFLRTGQAEAAVDAFKSAIAHARANAEYPLALGEALLAAGRTVDAEATLADSLRTDSMAGAPNLVMARIYAKEGRMTEAASYYHRAIYGQWRDDAPGNQVSARFELAELLAGRNAKAELLAELLPLQDLAPTDPNTREKLARFYLTAGAPARAEAIFRELVRAQPQNPDIHYGLGNAEFARGNYVNAQASFSAALRLRPDDRQARTGLEMCDQVLNLDPMRRGLAAQERYRRSVHVLELVAAKAPQCLPKTPSDSTVELLDSTNAAIRRHVPAAGQSETVEANLDLANKLWQAERSVCNEPVSTPDQPLQLVLAKAAQ